MDAAVALQILQWVAIVVVYLGLAAVLRETRLLRHQVTRLQMHLAAVTEGAAEEAVTQRLPAGVAQGEDAIVVVADTTCPSCAMTLDRLTRHLDRLRAPVTLLTWEPEEAWGHLDRRIRVVRDSDGWAALSHLTPPILLRVDGDGRVGALHLPAGPDDIDSTLLTWGALAAHPEPAIERGHA